MKRAGDRLSARESWWRLYASSPTILSEHLDDGSDIRIVQGELTQRWYLVAFAGTAGKPAAHYTYRTEAAAREAAAQFIAGRQRNVQRRQERATERQEFRTTLDVGRVLKDSWGYDQTNVDYYQVVAVSPSRKSVTLRKIAARSVQEGDMSGRCWPLADEFIGPETLHRVGPGDSVKVRDWGSWAHPWTPKPDYWSSYA